MKYKKILLLLTPEFNFWLLDSSVYIYTQQHGTDGKVSKIGGISSLVFTEVSKQ